MVEGTPFWEALPPAPQQATPARKGARCGPGAGSPHPHRPHPGHTGRGTLAARSRGRAAGGGTAPDTRLPSQRWQATPPGDGPPPTPRHAAPTGHAGQGDSVGPPHPHTRAHSTWVADPNSPPSERAVGGGTAPDLRCPSQWWKAPAPGTPFRHPNSEQRWPARAHAVEPVLGPHTRTDRTRDTRVAETRLAAQEDGRSREGQRLTPDAPHTSGRPPPPGDGPPPPPRHAAPTGHAGQGDSVGPLHPHTRAHSTWVADSPKPGRGEPGPDRPPPSTPDRARDRGRTRGGARTTWNGPTSAQCRERARCARHTTQGWGGSRRRGSTSAHTRKGHAGTNRRATGPSSRNAQTAWNGVSASEGTGHPDGTARHTQRGTHGAGRGKRERHNTSYRPEPPEPAASAVHTRTGHCTRQGSSGALRHAATPRLGSLRARPRGSHWQQASSTGPGAPAPGATTH